ncbi:MAG TPA: PTS sugar transporter subunit IIA [Gammaproteobacteria bacterium]|nr:PTS sugar transporter subunit IIA [Gammaproteobacteria bacterium]
MSTGVLLITHPGIGSAVLHSARRIVPDCGLRIRCLEVPLDADPERLQTEAAGLLQQLDQGQGVLVLTDIFGATPNNIARRLAEPGRVSVLAGLSLPMLVRLFNYPDGDLAGLCETAVTGAVRGIGRCEETA